MASNGGSDDDKSASGGEGRGDQKSSQNPAALGGPMAKHVYAFFAANIVPVDVTVNTGGNGERACPNCGEVTAEEGDFPVVRCHNKQCGDHVCYQCASDFELWTAPGEPEASETPTKRRKTRSADRVWWCAKHFREPGYSFPNEPINAEDCMALVYALVHEDAEGRKVRPDASAYFKTQMARLGAKGCTVEARTGPPPKVVPSAPATAVEPSPATDLP